MRKILTKNQGFVGMIEVVIVVALIMLVGIFIVYFLVQSYRSYTFSIEQTDLLRRGQTALLLIESEIRSLATIESAQNQSMTFYAYRKTDTLAPSKFRIFVQGTDLKQGVIEPHGVSPNFTYPQEDEKLKTLATFVKSGSSSIFYYYDENGTLLTQPIQTPAVKLVKIQLILQYPKSIRPTPITVQTQFQLRNRKTNL